MVVMDFLTFVEDVERMAIDILDWMNYDVDPRAFTVTPFEIESDHDNFLLQQFLESQGNTLLQMFRLAETSVEGALYGSQGDISKINDVNANKMQDTAQLVDDTLKQLQNLPTSTEKQEKIRELNKTGFVQSVFGKGVDVANLGSMSKGLLNLYDLAVRVIEEESKTHRIALMTAPITVPIVAVVEIVLVVISILFVMIESMQTNRHNETAKWNKQLFDRATLLVEQLPNLSPVDEFETGSLTSKDKEAVLKKRLRLLYSFSSKRTFVHDVEEFMSQFHLSSGTAMSGNYIDDAPEPVLRETFQHDDNKDEAIDFILYPMRVEELIGGSLPFQTSIVVKTKSRSFVYEVEHLLNETTAILKQFRAASALKSQPNATTTATTGETATTGATTTGATTTGATTTSQGSVTPATAASQGSVTPARTGRVVQQQTTVGQQGQQQTTVGQQQTTEQQKYTNLTTQYSDYFKLLGETADAVRKNRKRFVETFTVTDKNANKETIWDKWVELYQVDPNENYLARNFIQIAKVILRSYLGVLGLTKEK